MTPRTPLALLSVALFGLALVGCPASARPSYDPCERNADCESGDACIEIVFPRAGFDAEQSMCTRQNCVTDNDCARDARGGAAACLTFTGGRSTCFERCDARADCAENWSCESVSPASGGDTRICVPLT